VKCIIQSFIIKLHDVKLILFLMPRVVIQLD